MCHFLSAIVGKIPGGIKVYCVPSLISHEDQIAYFGLKDNGHSICRVEFSPRNGRYDDLAAYELSCEDPQKWLTDDRKEEVIDELRSIIEKRIISTSVSLLANDAYILTSGANVVKAINCYIPLMTDDASIHVCYQVDIETMEQDAKIHFLSDASSVHRMRDRASIDRAYGSADIVWMADQSSITLLSGSAFVHDKSPKARIANISGYARVGAWHPDSDAPVEHIGMPDDFRSDIIRLAYATKSEWAAGLPSDPLTQKLFVLETQNLLDRLGQFSQFLDNTLGNTEGT